VWYHAGKTTQGKIVAIGLEVHTSGSHGSKAGSLGDLTVATGSLTLEEDGKKKSVKNGSILKDGYIAAASFDESRGRFAIIGETFGKGTSKCYWVGMDGSIVECNLPEGFQFKTDEDYLWAAGARMRYVVARSRPWEYRERDLSTGDEILLTEGIRTMYMIRPSGAFLNEDAEYGIPSPNDKMNIKFVGSYAEVVDEKGSKKIALRGISRTEPELSPFYSRACRGWNDSFINPQSNIITWSRDSRFVYWCGVKQEVGFVVDTESGTSFAGPCLRGASWSDDGKAVTGTSDCGHQVESWDVGKVLG
jgi:hypothetical protein